IHQVFEDNDWLKRNADGTVTDTGWGSGTNHLYVCCPDYIEQVARQEIPLWNAGLNHQTWFIDVFATVSAYSCYSTNHPATELDTLAARVAICKYITEELGMAFWTEGAGEFLVPYAVYGEGPMSSYGVSGASPKYRIPLWSLVYHDCWENSWHTFGGNLNADANIWKTNDLYNILYASKQLMGFTADPNSSVYFYKPGLIENAIRSIREVTKVTQQVGLYEMVDHRFLSNDGNVQMTRYKNGVDVYVNFGGSDFTYGDLVIPAQGSITRNISEIIKANNTDSLNEITSWQSLTVPGPDDFAAWTNGSGSSAVSLGDNASWYGIKVYNPGATPQILAGNSLTLGAGGITLSGNNFSFSNRMILDRDQTWNLGTKALFARGPIAGNNVTINITSPASSYVDMLGSLADFTGTINYSAPARLRVLRFDGDAVVVNMQSGAAFDAYGYNGTTVVGDLITTNKNAALGGGDQNGTVTYEIGALGNDSTWAGRILNGGTGSTPTSIRKVGAGKWTLSGTNTYTGSTMIDGGTLALSGIGSLPNSSLIAISDNATLSVSGLSSTFTLGAAQTLSNNASTTGNLNGNLQTSSGTVSISYVSGTPAFSIGNGTLTLSSSTVFNINNTGSALAAGSYKIISKGTGGAVNGTMPSVVITGGGVAAGTSWGLGVISGELYLVSLPNTPTGLSATGSNAVVRLTWNASSGATSYKVKRATVSGGPYTVVGSPVGTSYTDSGLVNGTTYYYVVSAVNAGGESTNSAQDSATTVAPPLAPGGFTATGSNAVVFLDWNASSGATSYQLKRATANGGPYTVLSSPTATSYTDSAVVNDTTFYYVVSAVNAGGESANSAQASATPAVPEILKANNANNLNLGSSWQGGVVPGASQYAAWTNGSGSSAVSLGANASWYGLKVYNPGATPQILAGNSLTLGEGGIALSGNNFAFSNTLIVAADQVWKLGSKALFARGPITGTNVTIDITSSISSYVDMAGSLSNFSGTINYAAPARLRVLRFDGDNLVLNMQSGASFDAYGYNGTTIVGDLITTNKNAALGGGDQNGTVTYQIGALGNNSTWAGRILNGGSGTTPTSIRKVGAGRWTLSGTNTYTGSTVVNDGTL
ncbi:MAG: autotransporter-associated beta strand repeat-containing protein, partial [Verrucomicrobiota bacterium]